MSLQESSADKDIPALLGENTAGGDGVVGKSNMRGVVGESEAYYGVYGHSHGNAGVAGVSDGASGVYGESHAYQKFAGVQGINTHPQARDGYGVLGSCDVGTGVAGYSKKWRGVYGQSEANAGVVGVSEAFDGVWGESHGEKVSGVSGRNTHEHFGYGVWGHSDGDQGNGGAAGVAGFSEKSDGVWGQTNAKGFSGVAGRNTHPQFGFGVWGKSDGNAGGGGAAGVAGFSENSDGVWGQSNRKDFSGVAGRNTHPDRGYGVWGYSDGNNGTGVGGFSKTWRGVYGHSETNAGVVGESNEFDGVYGISHRPDRAGVSGRSLNPDGSVNKDGLAGWFDGKVVVTNDIILSNADCAEDFDVAQSGNIEPGTVMVLGAEGVLHQSQQAYDKRVAGVISGASHYKPTIVLDKQPAQGNRSPIALLGKVFCRVDASPAPVEVGDLLTTSDTPGHAMKATDSTRAFGSVIGKALRSLSEGRGLIPVLIALQ